MPPHAASIGSGAGISLASLRRFWAVAARWNSSRAPDGPRNLRRSSLRMRLRWATSAGSCGVDLGFPDWEADDFGRRPVEVVLPALQQFAALLDQLLVAIIPFDFAAVGVVE